MDQDPFKKQEQMEIRMEVATSEDWQDYKALRLEAITGKDEAMFGPISAAEDKVKSEEEWKKDLSSNEKFIILAWAGSQAIGLIIVKSKAEGAWDIGGGYTKENFRGKVPVKKTIAKILSEIKARGGTKALIVTKIDNKDMIKLAEVLGFKKFDIEGIWYKMELDLKNK